MKHVNSEFYSCIDSGTRERAKRGTSHRLQLSPYIMALGLGKIPSSPLLCFWVRKSKIFPFQYRLSETRRHWRRTGKTWNMIFIFWLVEELRSTRTIRPRMNLDPRHESLSNRMSSTFELLPIEIFNFLLHLSFALSAWIASFGYFLWAQHSRPLHTSYCGGRNFR